MHYTALLGGGLHDARHFGWNVAENVNHSWETLVEAVQNHVHQLNFSYRSGLMTAQVRAAVVCHRSHAPPVSVCDGRARAVWCRSSTSTRSPSLWTPTRSSTRQEGTGHSVCPPSTSSWPRAGARRCRTSPVRASACGTPVATHSELTARTIAPSGRELAITSDGFFELEYLPKKASRCSAALPAGSRQNRAARR
jgi:hypothetical protein